MDCATDKPIGTLVFQYTHRFQSESDNAITVAGCGAFLRTLLSFGCFPVMMSSASRRIWIIASQNLRKSLVYGLIDLESTHRSTSSSVSDSVGSISMQVEMGQEQVGGWNP